MVRHLPPIDFASKNLIVIVMVAVAAAYGNTVHGAVAGSGGIVGDS